LSDKIWLGATYLRDEGGYEIVLKSLVHYKKRLRTIGNSPELKQAAAMFATLLQQEATKTIPRIEDMIKRIQDGLSDAHLLNSLSNEIQFLLKALLCYEADIQKAQDTGHEYFVNLVGELPTIKHDLDAIKIAINRINQFSV
jgi:hypothetical protein